ncbi:MAG: DUF4838 domain-containing protein [Caldilinea sp. CFX5]|nr:DUF4838 domain-containing protein [Caldilinea sp. CFX5]
MTWFTRRGLELVPSDLTSYPHWLAEMRQAKLNLLIIHVPRSMAELVEYAASAHFVALAAEAADAGIDIEWAPHSLNELLPRAHFAAHPDWFRMDIMGQRTPDFNMCVASADAFQVVEQNAARLAAQLQPTTHRYYFWGDDGRPWCYCPECVQLGAADQNMRFTNTVLAGIRTVDPAAQLSGLAYYSTLGPLEQIKPAEGVFLEYAPIQRSFLYALDDDQCAVNRDEFAKLQRLLPTYDAQPNAQVLDYWLDESLFWRTAGRPEKLPRLPFSAAVLQRDLQLYADLGFRSIVSYAVLLGQEYRTQHGQPPIQVYGEALMSIRGPRHE